MKTNLEISSSEKISNLGKVYSEQGFYCPVYAISEAETQELRLDYEKAERELRGDNDLALLKAYPNSYFLHLMLDANKFLVNAAKEILGKNILVWSAALFIKEASQKVVSWHQDLTYWQLNDIKEVTCWFAVSSARKKAGCMKFIAGSHKNRIVPQ